MSTTDERNAARLEVANRLESIACNIQAPDEQVTVMARAVAWLREGLSDEPREGHSMKVTEEMVTRFLHWELPPTFRPDAGISFEASDNPLLWPTGTNLLNGPEARAMLEHVLASPEPRPATQPARFVCQNPECCSRATCQGCGAA